MNEHQAYSHLLVNFGSCERGVACMLAAMKRFPGMTFNIVQRDGCHGVHVSLPALGPNSTPDDSHRFEVIQQFCAGYWYAISDGSR